MDLPINVLWGHGILYRSDLAEAIPRPARRPRVRTREKLGETSDLFEAKRHWRKVTVSAQCMTSNLSRCLGSTRLDDSVWRDKVRRTRLSQTRRPAVVRGECKSDQEFWPLCAEDQGDIICKHFRYNQRSYSATTDHLTTQTTCGGAL